MDSDSTAADSVSQPQDRSLLTPQEVTAKHLEEDLDSTLLQHGFDVLRLLKSMATKVKEGDRWFLIPVEWYNKWEKYCYSDLLMGEPSDGEGRREDPGKIDFMQVFEDIGSSQIPEMRKNYKWTNYQIKRGLREGADYMFVTEIILALLHKQFGSV